MRATYCLASSSREPIKRQLPDRRRHPVAAAGRMGGSGGFACGECTGRGERDSSRASLDCLPRPVVGGRYALQGIGSAFRTAVAAEHG